MSNHDLIDDAGRLQFGKAHRNADINDIAADDPGYLYWMLNNVDDLTEDDREVIRVALQFAKRGSRR